MISLTAAGLLSNCEPVELGCWVANSFTAILQHDGFPVKHDFFSKFWTRKWMILNKRQMILIMDRDLQGMARFVSHMFRCVYLAARNCPKGWHQLHKNGTIICCGAWQRMVPAVFYSVYKQASDGVVHAMVLCLSATRRSKDMSCQGLLEGSLTLNNVARLPI